MTEKKIHGIRLTPATAKALKVAAAEAGLTQGALLEVLLVMARDGRLSDEELAEAMSSHYMRGQSLPMGGPR